MIKQVLTIEQMKHLAELGVNFRNASMCWINNADMSARMLSIHDEFCYEMSCLDPVPAFTLQDILDLLPKYFRKKDEILRLEIEKDSTGWTCKYLYVQWFVRETAIEAAYEILCWYMKNKKV